MRGRVLRDVTEQLEVSFLFLFRVHRQRLVDRFSRLGSVPRVDDQRSVQRVSCGSETSVLGQFVWLVCQ